MSDWQKAMKEPINAYLKAQLDEMIRQRELVRMLTGSGSKSGKTIGNRAGKGNYGFKYGPAEGYVTQNPAQDAWETLGKELGCRQT